MPGNSRNSELKYHLAGWVLFLFCAVLFIAASIRNHDALSLAASILFLIGCVVFLVPLAAAIKDSHSSD